MKDNISVCFFPTETIFVDDSNDFLDSITLNLNHKKQKYRFFSNVYQAIEYIEKKSKHNIWYDKYLVNLEEEIADKKLLEIDFTGIYKQAFNPHRKDVITCIVIDYDMPEINGIELCERLRHLPIQKILLTGAADEKLAVEAFNSRLIDCFIGKHTQNIYEILNNKISQASLNYFAHVSNLFARHDHHYNKTNLFFCSEFQTFFSSYIDKNNIVEFYTLESEYLYLLIDDKGKTSIFGIAPKEQLAKINEYLPLENDSIESAGIADNLVFFPSRVDFLQGTKHSNGFIVKKSIIHIRAIPYYYFYLKDIELGIPKDM